MPPKKKARRSVVTSDNDSVEQDATPPRRSSRPTRGVGGHAAQLQRAGERVCAPARKQKKTLNISDSEVNPMAPSQKKGKKNVAKGLTTSSDPKASQDPRTSPRPILYRGCSSDRFGFKAPQSNGHKKVGQDVGERDTGDKRKSVREHEHDSGREKARSGLGERDVGNNRESARSLLERDMEIDGDNDERESIDQQMDYGDDLVDFDQGPHQLPHDDDEDEAQVDSGRENFDDEGENEAQGDSNQEDLDDLDAEQDNDVYDVLERHQANNGQRKAPSSTYLSKGYNGARTSTYSKSSGQHTSQRVVLSKSSGQRTSQRAIHSKPPRSVQRIARSKSPRSAQRIARSKSPRSAQRIARSKSPRSAQRIARSKSPRRRSSQRVPSVGAPSVQVPHRSSPHPHSRFSSACSKSPRRRSSQQEKYMHASSSHMHSSRWRSPSRAITSSSRSLTQPIARGSSPSRSPSDCATSPTPSTRSRSATPNDARRHGNGIRNIKASQENPSKLGFYPPAWQAFLQEAKLDARLQAVLTHPVPEHQMALNLAREVLDSVLWRYHEEDIKLEKGFFPEYSKQMSQLLRDDLFTFRTELRKVVISIAKRSYNIFPKGSAMRKEEAQKCVTATAAKLIKTGDYLRIPDSSQGKYKNFVSQALMDACIEFYYGNSSKALKHTSDFHQTIPINGLVLVAAVMKGVISGFRETGTENVPSLSADQCRTDFNALRKSVDKLLDIPERREELEEMLGEWARIGMGGVDFDADGDLYSDTEDVNVVL